MIPETFHTQVASAYLNLQEEIAAVKPLTEDEVVDSLRIRRRSELKGLDAIPEENLDGYRAAMSDQRVSALRD